MEREQIDLSVFKFEPYSKKTYKKLSEYEEFKILKDDKDFKFEIFVDYIILMYDFKSPLRDEFPFISPEQNLNYSRKKMEAAKLAGYETVLGKDGKRKFNEATQAIILMQSTPCNEAIARYISLFGRPEYAALIAYEEMLITKVKKAIDGVDSKEDRDIHKVIEFLYGKISELSDDLFGGRETIEARQAFYAIAEKQDLNIFPEQIATIMKNEGALPVEFSPFYGKMPDKDIKEMQEWKSKFLGNQQPS
jgi:hypothetical protein